MLNALVVSLPSTVSFVSGLSTADIATCQDLQTVETQPTPVVVTDSLLPSDTVGAQLLLPLHPFTWLNPMAQLRADEVRQHAASFRSLFSATPTCYWRGQASGHAVWQTIHHKGRTSCSPKETDRECVVRIGPLLNLSLDGKVRHENSGLDLFARDSSRPPACILALDGFSFPSLLSDSLVQGSLTVRVGGIASDEGRWPAGSPTPVREQRFSEATWFEPLLRDGYHYIRTSVDDLSRTMRTRVAGVDPATLRGIAERGQRAARALFTPTSVGCYTLLAAAALAASQSKQIEEADVALSQPGRSGFRPACQVLDEVFNGKLWPAKQWCPGREGEPRKMSSGRTFTKSSG